MGEEGEGNPSGEDHVFEDKDADVPEDDFCERARENKWEEIEEVCWKEEEVCGNDDTEGSPHIVSYDEGAPLKGGAVLLPLDRQYSIKQRCADAVEEAWKDQEDSPEERKALAENACEEQRKDERPGIQKQGTEGSAALSKTKDACLAPNMKANGPQ